jgi:hypothetical protein
MTSLTLALCFDHNAEMQAIIIKILQTPKVMNCFKDGGYTLVGVGTGIFSLVDYSFGEAPVRDVMRT